MCGIAGAAGLPELEARSAVEEMCDQMTARGPDDHGVEQTGGPGWPVALGSRRLAIIDPSPAGHQPMYDPGRGTTIVFNGMIYNFAELRERLHADGETFVSDCDTEVVLKAYGRFGPECVRHLRGMFAFSVWDPDADQLFLARDRLGIKPLYYAHTGERFLFASQVKALLRTGLLPRRLSPAGLASYLTYGAVSEPLTAIDGVRALPAGHTALVRRGELRLARYWAPPRDEASVPAGEDAARSLRGLLEETVERHLVSDAPLGVFLSGGIDSSILAAVAARHTDRLRTVSVVFDDPELSEAPYTRLMAAHVGSEHVQVDLRPDDLLRYLDSAFGAMDQPTFDGINTYVVSRAAAMTGLKVALSGLGADELFDGYGYVRRVAALERARLVPQPLRRTAGRALGALVGAGRGAKLGEWLSAPATPGSSYDLLRRVFLPEELRALSGVNGDGTPPALDRESDLFNQISVLDLTNYTKNVLLRDTDAMSMANSLEVRVPYLDHELVERALRLPARTKGRNKALLLAACSDLLPREVTSRRKQAFVLPIARWLHRELRDEVDERLRRPPDGLEEILDSAVAQGVWQRYLAGGQRWLQPWSLYALSRWTESLGEVAPAVSR
ncbi:MAG: asparagine synthase (glutamine-hydrolyzing) [Actinobacteria bacterium]|nr:asparagine synthase (glutamine-hydrolyzing) [Actinomycetota bacterium]